MLSPSLLESLSLQSSCFLGPAERADFPPPSILPATTTWHTAVVARLVMSEAGAVTTSGVEPNAVIAAVERCCRAPVGEVAAVRDHAT